MMEGWALRMKSQITLGVCLAPHTSGGSSKEVGRRPGGREGVVAPLIFVSMSP